MIDQTYGHLARDADDYELGRLDDFDAWIPADERFRTRPTEPRYDEERKKAGLAGRSAGASPPPREVERGARLPAGMRPA